MKRPLQAASPIFSFPLFTFQVFPLQVFSLLASSFLLLAAPALQADEEKIRYYDVELIIFENQAPVAENATPEIWKKSGELLVPEEKITLGYPLDIQLDPKYEPTISFKLLTAEELILQEELDLLKQNEEYKVLLHTGWRQPGMPRNKALNVYFKHAIADTAAISETGEDTSTVFNPVEKVPTPDTASEPVATNTPTPVPATVPDGPSLTEEFAASDLVEPDPAGDQAEDNPFIQPQLSNVQGVIKIVLSRYLHTDVELLYKKAGSTQAIDRFDADYLENRQNSNVVYYMKQNRRMRSKELHYIDHPVLGVLVKITPYEYIKPEPALDPAAPVGPNGQPVVPVKVPG